MFTEAPGGALAFYAAPGPSDAEVAAVLATVRHRVQRLLVRHGLEPADDATGPADRLVEVAALLAAYDVTVVDYLGRGQENFQEEIHRIFDWMKLHRRDFFPREFKCDTMRASDNYFWFIEVHDFPKPLTNPANWPPPKDTRPFTIEGKITKANGVEVKGGKRSTVWLAPEMVDFTTKISINRGSKTIVPSAKVLLEDVRTRGDRQHPFWAKVEL